MRSRSTWRCCEVMPRTTLRRAPRTPPERAERVKLGHEQWGFWESYEEQFGPSGRDPRGYWDFRIGHVEPWCSPDRVGELRPVDLLGAMLLYEALYMKGEDG